MTSRQQLHLDFKDYKDEECPAETNLTASLSQLKMPTRPSLLRSSKNNLTLPYGDFQVSSRRSFTRRLRQKFVFPDTVAGPESCMSETDLKLKEIRDQANILTIKGKKYAVDINDLEEIGKLGSGISGNVVKMIHKPSNEIIAVKEMRRSGNEEENKRIRMDAEVILKCRGCPYTVHCFGIFMTDLDVWICMELMATSLDKLLERYGPIPEQVLGKIAVAVLKGLNYLKEVQGFIHRDVKPSNILLNENGEVKLCDFGISGMLIDSFAKSKTGCTAYMAPERIQPDDPKHPEYDIRADVWSFGLSLVELATGKFPYECNLNEGFEVLAKVLMEEAPRLPNNLGFSRDFRSLIQVCLAKDYKKRPKYAALLEHKFIKRYEKANVDVAGWCAGTMIPETRSPVKWFGCF